MKPHACRCRIVAAALALALLVTSCARNTVTLPPGWTPGSCVTGTAGRFAVSLASSDAAGSMRVLQRDPAGALVSTDIPGRVFSLSYLGDGSRLLVGYAPADAPSSFAILTTAGATLWAASMANAVPSESGESLAELRTLAGGDSEVVTRDVATGAVVARFRAPSQVRALLPLGGGSRVIVAMGSSVRCYDRERGRDPVWFFELPSRSFRATALRAFGAGRILVEQERGQFTILGREGRLVRHWDPVKSGVATADRDRHVRARLRPYESTNENRVYLFDGEGDLRAWELDTGTLAEVKADLAAPEGLERLPRIVDGHLVFIGGRAITLRRLPEL